MNLFDVGGERAYLRTLSLTFPPARQIGWIRDCDVFKVANCALPLLVLVVVLLVLVLLLLLQSD